MRTTQKRRSFGSANGNGASPPSPPIPPEPPQARPVTPPSGAPSPRSAYRVRRNPLRLIGKVVMWLIVIVLVAVGALAGGVKLYFDYSVAAIRPHSKEVIAAQEILEAPTAGQPATAIVIGYDKRAGEIEAGSRSDTVMLVRIDPKKNVVTMLSFPRDLIVDIPGCSGHPSWSGRINEAYAYCGPRGTLATVKQLTGSYRPKMPMVGSGPYIVTEFDSNRIVRMERNPNWRGDPPAFDEIQWIKYGSTDAVERALTLGEVDMITEVEASTFDRLSKTENIKAVKSPSPSFTELAFNLCPRDICPDAKYNPAVQDLTVRQAIGFAVDRERVNQIANRGTSFALDPKHPNTLEPHKRPFHTIIPAFATKNGQPWLVFGVMGGDMQPQGQTQIILNMVDFGMNVQEAGDAARWHHTGTTEPTGTPSEGVGKVEMESGISQEVVAELTKRGHVIVPGTGGFGGYQAIMRDPKTGVYWGASESTKDGEAIGY